MTSSDQNEDDVKPSGAKVLGRESLRAALPKRFYKEAGVAEAPGGFRITLDRRIVKTPGKKELVVPARNLALAIADEWAAQAERIDPATMPLTRLANVAIDAVAEHMADVAADIEAYAASDLLCYRALGPEGLVQRQHAYWDPVLAWAEREIGVRLVVRQGVMPVAQESAATAAVGIAIQGLDAFRLACVHVMTTLTGSALLALAHLKGRLTAEQAWSAATVDETWQVEHWGRDAEAEARDEQRRADFEAASRLVTLLGP
ncbi:MAG: ATP12 family protein [Hyphomicrobium sp.]|jgi:chaperone required for assembly of F1-ATPase